MEDIAVVPRSNVVYIEPSLVALNISEITVEQYLQVAIVTLLVYDTVCTMDKEVKHFWKLPFNAVSIVFLLNRCVGLVGAVALLFCNFAIWTANVSTEDILTVRVLALYSRETRPKSLLVCLWALLALEVTIKLALYSYITLLEDIAVGVFPNGLTICTYNNFPPIALGLIEWIMPMAYGVLLVVLALYKAVKFWRTSTGFTGFTLIRVLVRDQLIYFFIAVACSIINVLDFKLDISNGFLESLLSALGSPSFLCLLGSRLLLNLKEIGEQGFYLGTDLSMDSSMPIGVDIDFTRTSTGQVISI